MRILILGGSGMIGSCLFQNLGLNNKVFATFRSNPSSYFRNAKDLHEDFFFNVEARNIKKIKHIALTKEINVVVNAIGITKQLISKLSEEECSYINSTFPHDLYKVCDDIGVRLIQLSTDCIYSGSRGFYSEQDAPDADDFYGKSKIIGEINQPSALTIRKSTIGLEIGKTHGLIEWFLKSSGSIHGYTNAIYSGLTTIEFSNVLNFIINEQKDLSGIWNVSSSPISKYDLLNKLSIYLKRDDIKIVPDNHFYCDRSLNGAAFFERTGYLAPSWDKMLDDLSRIIMERQSKSSFSKK